MGTLHQEPHIKSEDLYFGETSIFGKMPTVLENFSPFSCENFIPKSPLGLNHPCLLTSTSAASKELRCLV